MPELRFVILGQARTKKNRQQANHRPSAPFVAWEDGAIPQLRRLRAEHARLVAAGLSAGTLPLTVPCTIEAVFYIKGPEGDAGGYMDGLCDLLDGTRLKAAHRKQEKRLKLGVPFVCDWQIVGDDRQFNAGFGPARVVRCAAGAEPRVEVVIRWGAP